MTPWEFAQLANHRLAAARKDNLHPMAILLAPGMGAFLKSDPFTYPLSPGNREMFMGLPILYSGLVEEGNLEFAYDEGDALHVKAEYLAFHRRAE